MAKSRPTTASEMHYEICQIHPLEKNKHYCTECGFTMCEKCWRQGHNKHLVMLFDVHREEVKDKLSRSKEHDKTLNEKNIGRVTQDFKDTVTSECLKGDSLLDQINELFIDRNECIKSVMISNSSDDALQQERCFREKEQSIKTLIEQFQGHCRNVMEELPNFLSDSSSCTSKSGGNFEKYCHNNLGDDAFRNTSFKVKSHSINPTFHPIESINRVATDSNLNIYVSEVGNNEVWNMKATVEPTISLSVEQSKIFKGQSNSAVGEITIANDKLYAVVCPANSNLNGKLCVLDKVTLEITKTLNTAKAPKGINYTWLIKAKDKLLVLLLLAFEPNKDSQLMVFENDIFMKILTIKADVAVDRTKLCSVEQYLIVLRKIQKDFEMSCLVLKWDELKKLDNLPNFHSVDLSTRNFPQFFSLGGQVHAFIVTTFREAPQQKCLEGKIFTNVIRRQHEVNLSDEIAFDLINENIPSMEKFWVIERLWDNIILCGAYCKGGKFFLLIEINP